MRFSCERDDLYKAVQGVLGVVASKGVHAVYESVQITADADALTLQATDLEIGMKVGVGPSETLSIDRPGTAVIPAQRLASILREFPKGTVSFDWDPERRECKLKAANARFKIQGPSPEDFPEIPDVGGAEEVAVSAGALRRMIKRTAFAAAKERMRYALNGLLLQVKGGTIELVPPMAGASRSRATPVTTRVRPNCAPSSPPRAFSNSTRAWELQTRSYGSLSATTTSGREQAPSPWSRVSSRAASRATPRSSPPRAATRP